MILALIELLLYLRFKFTCWRLNSTIGLSALSTEIKNLMTSIESFFNYLDALESVDAKLKIKRRKK